MYEYSGRGGPTNNPATTEVAAIAPEMAPETSKQSPEAPEPQQQLIQAQ